MTATSTELSVELIEDVLKEKEAAMNKAMLDLKNYKIQNHVLNLNEQAKSLYGQLSDFETRRALAEKDVAAGGKSLGAERAIEGIGFGVGMHLHAAPQQAHRHF